MKKIFASLSFFVGFVTAQINGHPVTDGPDAFGYIYGTSQGGFSYSWEELRSNVGAVLISNYGDDSVFAEMTNISLSFSFPYYGSFFSNVNLSINGFLTVGTNISSLGTTQISSNYSTSAPNGYIAPLSVDLNTTTTFTGTNDHPYGDKHGRMWWQLFGTAPNRYFIAEWDHVDRHSASDTMFTFQAVLYEDGTIEFRYKDVGIGSSSYTWGTAGTIAIESPDGATGLTYSYNSLSLTNDFAIRFFSGTPVTINFDKYDSAASGSMSSITFPAGYNFAIPLNSFSHSTGSFEGWSLTPGGLKQYSEGGHFLMPSNSITLYACWGDKNYLVNGDWETGTTNGWTIPLGSGTGSDYALLDGYGRDSSWGVISSYNDTVKKQKVDLNLHSLAGSNVAGVNTRFLFRESVAAYYGNTALDYATLTIRIYDSSDSLLASASTGVKTINTNQGWTELETAWTNTAGYANIRYIEVESTGNDGESWAGHYGTRFDEARLHIYNNVQVVAPVSVTLSFNKGSLSAFGTMSSLSLNSGSNLTIPQVQYTLAGKSFEGWSLSSGGPKQYSAGGQIIVPTNDFILYACWGERNYLANGDWESSSTNGWRFGSLAAGKNYSLVHGLGRDGSWGVVSASNDSLKMQRIDLSIYSLATSNVAGSNARFTFRETVAALPTGPSGGQLYDKARLSIRIMDEANQVVASNTTGMITIYSNQGWMELSVAWTNKAGIANIRYVEVESVGNDGENLSGNYGTCFDEARLYIASDLLSFKPPVTFYSLAGQAWNLVGLSWYSNKIETALTNFYTYGKSGAVWAWIWDNQSEDYSRLNQINGTEAFWIWPEKEVSYSFAKTDLTNIKPKPVQYELAAGWNLVTAIGPYVLQPRAVSEPGGVLTTNLSGMIEPIFWGWSAAETSYEPLSNFEPWRGVFVYAKRQSTLYTVPLADSTKVKTSLASSLILSKRVSQCATGWKGALALVTPSGSDRYCNIGAWDGAGDFPGADSFDLRKAPPAPGKSVRLTVSEGFAADIRKPITETASWQIELKAPEANSARFQWNLIEAVQRGLSVAIVDETGALLSVQAAGEVVLYSDSDRELNSYVTVRVGTAAFASLLRGGVVPAGDHANRLFTVNEAAAFEYLAPSKGSFELSMVSMDGMHLGEPVQQEADAGSMLRFQVALPDSAGPAMVLIKDPSTGETLATRLIVLYP